MSEKQRVYIAIDLKSFYASVECVERGLDPLSTNLVVADVSRTEIAKDVVQRLRQHYHHLAGCAKYTLSHQMKAIRAVWETEDEVTACRLECSYKHRLALHRKNSRWTTTRLKHQKRND